MHEPDIAPSRGLRRSAPDPGRPLAEIERIGGRIAPLPEEADAGRYSGGVVILSDPRLHD